MFYPGGLKQDLVLEPATLNNIVFRPTRTCISARASWLSPKRILNGMADPFKNLNKYECGIGCRQNNTM